MRFRSASRERERRDFATHFLRSQELRSRRTGALGAEQRSGSATQFLRSQELRKTHVEQRVVLLRCSMHFLRLQALQSRLACFASMIQRRKENIAVLCEHAR